MKSKNILNVSVNLDKIKNEFYFIFKNVKNWFIKMKKKPITLS